MARGVGICNGCGSEGEVESVRSVIGGVLSVKWLCIDCLAAEGFVDAGGAPEAWVRESGR